VPVAAVCLDPCANSAVQPRAKHTALYFSPRITHPRLPHGGPFRIFVSTLHTACTLVLIVQLFHCWASDCDPCKLWLYGAQIFAYARSGLKSVISNAQVCKALHITSQKLCRAGAWWCLLEASIYEGICTSLVRRTGQIMGLCMIGGLQPSCARSSGQPTEYGAKTIMSRAAA
jgi:hypothetical protein